MSIEQNLQQLRQEIEQTAQQAQRDPKSIALLAVSKFQSIEAIQAAIEVGQRCFGENYIQEALAKIEHFKTRNEKLNWHLIGPIQSNKTALVARHFDFVQTLDRLKIAQRLQAQRLKEQTPLNVLIQVNLSEEATKSGILATELPTFVDEILKLDRLRLRGLMIIPKAENEFQKQCAIFKQAAYLFEAVKKQCLNQNAQIDTLSMGMSDDFEAAILSGSTMIRLGTAIFGARQTHHSQEKER